MSLGSVLRNAMLEYECGIGLTLLDSRGASIWEIGQHELGSYMVMAMLDSL
jgi:hypothetical protein